MAVDIDLELQASDVLTEINNIGSALKALDIVADDVDIDDSIDSNGITGSIGNVIERLSDLDAEIDRISQKIDNELNDINVSGEQKLIHEHTSPDGETNDGRSSGNDPPGRPGTAALSGRDSEDGESGISRNQLAGFIRKFNNKEVSLGLNRQDISELSAPYVNTVRGLRGKERNLGEGTIPANYDGFEDGELEDMDWNHLQRFAARENVYKDLDTEGSEDPGKETLIRRLKSQRFNQDRVYDPLTTAAIPESREEVSAATGRSNRRFLPNSLSPLQLDIAQTMAEAKYDAFGQADPQPFNNFNGVDASELSASEMEDIASGRASTASLPPEKDPAFSRSRDEHDRRVGVMRDAFGGLTRKSDLPNLPSTDLRDVAGMGSTGKDIDFSSRKKAMGKFRKANKKLGRSFKRLIPTMSKYMRLLAALLPVAVALGAQILGVAAAMGALGVAGASMMGLGLIGHGDSMAESFSQAKIEMRDLKQELFQEVQPLAQLFAPIQGRMFDAIPGAMDGIFEEMEGLTQFEGTLFALGGSLVGGVKEFFAIINRNAGAISDLSVRFGRLIGSGLLDFFEWLIQEADSNQNFLVALGKDMLTLVGVAYQLSMAVAKIVERLGPLWNVLAFVSRILNNGVLVGIIALGAYLWVFIKMVLLISALGGVFTSLATYVTGATITMAGFTISLWNAVAAATVLVGVLGALSLGTSVLLGGVAGGAAMSQVPDGGNGRNQMGGAGNTVYNDNRSYTFNQNGDNADYASQKAIENTIERTNETQNAREAPSITTN